MINVDLLYQDATAVALVQAIDRQLPYATSRAINTTLEQAQRAVQTSLSTHFLLRRRQFIERTIKFETADRSTKTKLVGTIRVDPARAYLAKFEEGGSKRPTRGGFLAVPDPAIAGASVVPARLRPRALQLLRLPGRGRIKALGLLGTFLVQTRSGGQGILQRTGRGVRVLYWFQKAVRLPSSLRFVATATYVAQRTLEPNFQQALANALATAR